MRYLHKILLLIVICLVPLMGNAQQNQTAGIRARAEVHTDRILLRWIATDAECWDLLNRHGVRLERLTVVRSGIVLDKPEVKLLAAELKPQETEALKNLAVQYPMGAVIAQAIFGEDFEVSFGENPISKAIALDELRQQRYLFALYAADLCFPVAKEVGWGWEDKDINSEERYLYRIIPLVSEKKKNIHEGSVFVVANETTKFVPPIGLAVQCSESGALLSWDYNTLSYLYAAYFIEKSEDGTNFERISDLPVTRVADTDKNPHAPITYLDSIPLNKRIYYRVVGVTPFGSESSYSDVVSGIAYPTLRAAPMITTSGFDESGEADITWQFDETQQGLISGFNVLHSTNDKNYTLFAENIEPQKRKFHIGKIDKHIYYKIEAKAQQGASTVSPPVLIQPIDSVPPAIPQGLAAHIDTLGIVSLTWKPNTDADIYGYRLYRGLTKGEELIPLTDLAIRGTTYTDTIRLDNLNHNVYYALTALDERYNQSEQSETIEVLKPNTLPPTAPVIARAVPVAGKNIIEWEAGEDVYLAGFIVTRTDVDEKATQVAFRVEGPTTTRYEDNDIEPGKSYLYQVVAYSIRDLRSPLSNPIRVKSLQNSLGNKNVKFRIDAISEGIAIKWNVPDIGIISVTLYKLDESGTRFLYRENLPASGELLDKEVWQGKENEYLLVVAQKGHRPFSIKKNILL